jgi:16S rRNA (cytidine1402-2'-O)-methyltransferase
MSQSILYVVATPIGNLGDITLRALEILKSVDVIAAEDTRHTSGLLSHLGITKKLIAVHQHNEQQSAESLVARLQAGESIALVTDAGTPAVSDPGAVVVAAVRAAGFKIVPIPGASAVVAALSASGIVENGFTFIGFLPASGGARKKVLQALALHPYTLVFYEAPHRIIESIADMAAGFGAERNIVIARELTKTFETIHKCSLADAVKWLENDSNQQRGEFVLLLEAPPIKAFEGIAEDEKRVLKALLADLPLKQAVKLTAEITGAKKNMIYEFALTLKSIELKHD